MPRLPGRQQNLEVASDQVRLLPATLLRSTLFLAFNKADIVKMISFDSVDPMRKGLFHVCVTFVRFYFSCFRWMKIHKKKQRPIQHRKAHIPFARIEGGVQDEWRTLLSGNTLSP